MHNFVHECLEDVLKSVYKPKKEVGGAHNQTRSKKRE